MAINNQALINESRFSIEIESLRGIAALSVLIGHFHLLILSHFLQTSPRIMYILASSRVISTLVGGLLDPQPAPLLFFTISGLVLGRQLRKEPINSISAFIAYLCRRVFRLLPLVWATTIFAFILAYFIGINIDFSLLYAHLTLSDISLNAPLWSLQVEICCSFFFPFLFWIFAKGGITSNILLFIALCGLSYFWQSPIFIQFLVFFHAGLLIDYLNFNCKKKYRIVNPLSLIFFGLIFILAPEFSMGPRNTAYGNWQSWVLPEILACSFILFFVIHCNSLINHFLRLSVVRYLGKISFSIYLIHLPLLGFMVEKIKPKGLLQFMWFSIAYFSLIILSAAFSYRWIELPANRFGKSLSFILFEKNKRKATNNLNNPSVC